MTESEQKIKGQWFTPDNVANEMVNMTPDTWWHYNEINNTI